MDTLCLGKSLGNLEIVLDDDTTILLETLDLLVLTEFDVLSDELFDDDDSCRTMVSVEPLDSFGVTELEVVVDELLDDDETCAALGLQD